MTDRKSQGGQTRAALRRRSPRSLVVGSTVLLVLLAGCTSNEATKAGATLTARQVADRYGYSADTAALTPVFALVPEYKDPDDGYARDLLARDCLAGVVQYNAVAPGMADPIFDPRTSQVIFNPDVARRLGYPGLRSAKAINAIDDAIPDDTVVTPSISSAMEACGKKADDRLGTPPEGALSGIEGIGWEAFSTDKGLQAAATAWRECMTPMGVVDLPKLPFEMPSRSVLSADLVDADGNISGSSPAPSDRERQVAVADANCRDQAGVDRAALKARADSELTAIGKNVKAFEAARESYRAYEVKVDEVIAQYR